jgi:hypothetical protein
MDGLASVFLNSGSDKIAWEKLFFSIARLKSNKTATFRSEEMLSSDTSHFGTKPNNSSGACWFQNPIF